MSLYSGIELPGKPDLENIRKLDLLPLGQIGRMERVGIAIDLPYLADLSSELGREMAELQTDISSYIPPDTLAQFATRAAEIEDEEGSAELNANSADQIRTLLFEVLKIGGGKDLKRTDSGKISTGKKQLEICRDDHPVVGKILAFKERSKLKSAFGDSLPRKARIHPRGPCCPICEYPHDVESTRVHYRIKTTRADTGRMAVTEGLHQIPIRTELGARIRKAFIAPAGRRLVSTDWSQIELRDLAHLANCKSMIRVYENDGDIHDDTARSCFGIPADQPTDKVAHRIPAKTANFLIAYSGEAKALYAQLLVAFSNLLAERKLDAIPDWFCLAWCEWFIARWYEGRPEVKEYHDLQEYRARRYGVVWTACGRIRRVPEIHSCHSWIRAAGVRQGGNMPIQGCCADQLRLAMSELEEEFLKLWDGGRGVLVLPVLPFHDQLIVEVEEDYADAVGDMMSWVFSQVMVDRQTGENLFRVPIKSDSEVLERWQKS